MKLSTLQKLGCISLIGGSILLTAYSIFFSTLMPIDQIRQDYSIAVLNSNYVWNASVAFFGLLFMLFGFTAVYSRLYKDSGIVGFLGYIFISIAYMIKISKVTWEIFLYPVLATNQNSIFLLKDIVFHNDPGIILFRILASATIFIGIVLFCIALIRSKEFPRIAGILIFIGAIIYGIGPMITVLIAIGGIVIFSIGCLMLGLNLIKGQ